MMSVRFTDEVLETQEIGRVSSPRLLAPNQKGSRVTNRPDSHISGGWRPVKGDARVLRASVVQSAVVPMRGNANASVKPLFRSRLGCDGFPGNGQVVDPASPHTSRSNQVISPEKQRSETNAPARKRVNSGTTMQAANCSIASVIFRPRSDGHCHEVPATAC